MNKKITISLLIFPLCFYLNGAVLITSQTNAPAGQTFPFSVNKNIFSSNNNFYVGANEKLENNQAFALARLQRGTPIFTPLAPEKINFNGTPDQNNPIFGKKIIALGMLKTEEGLGTRDQPLVVASNDESMVYLLENISRTENIVMVASGYITDAQGQITAGIIDLATDYDAHGFAAVKPHDGQFGDPNSGIALLIKGATSTQQVFGQIDVVLGAVTNQQLIPQALLLDPTSPALNIQSPTLAQIEKNIIAMHWDSALQRLFVGINVTSNSVEGDGARGVAIIRFTKEGGIELQPIAPDTAFASGNTQNIVGIRGANQQVAIHALNSLYTSTGLNYLIIVGGSGDATTNQQSVSALPLINSGDNLGAIAQKNAQPNNIFTNGQVERLIGRTLSEAATTPDEMPQATDVAVQVGGGILTAGPIVNIITRDDTVFAYVGDSSDNPGVYSSQALFNASGTIKSWTNWQRAAGTTDNIFAAALNGADGNFILASGDTADTINTIKRTVWSNGSPEGLQPLTTILDDTFSNTNGGIQSLQTFPQITLGLNAITLLATGGIGTVVLTQTGTINNNDIVIPTPGAEFNNAVMFDNGIIDENVNAKTVIIEGGALNNVGPITALEIASNIQQSNGANSWLFVGGSDGLAILSQQNGSGWNTLTGLSNNLTELTAGMSFKTIGNYTFVKKLIYDGDFLNNNYLYVITHSTVDRINLNTSNFATNTLDVTTIATTGADGVAQRGGFLDGIFSQALGVIATTNGLLRMGDGKDVRIITSEADADWTPVTISENAGAPTALYAVTQSNRPQDITRNTGGQFYVLTANVGLNQSRINRFAVQPLQARETVTAQTIEAFDDLFVKNIPAFLLSLGEYRSNFATDGALYFETRNKNGDIPPVTFITPGEPRVGVNNVGDRSIPINIDLQSGTEINYLNRSQASGSWIIAGNFNTQVLE